MSSPDIPVNPVSAGRLVFVQKSQCPLSHSPKSACYPWAVRLRAEGEGGGMEVEQPLNFYERATKCQSLKLGSVGGMQCLKHLLMSQ